MKDAIRLETYTSTRGMHMDAETFTSARFTTLPAPFPSQNTE